MTVAVVDSVTKRFGAIVALDGVSFDVGRESTLALLGPNGAGKSTLISLLLGLRRPDTGTVRVAGRNPRDHRSRVLVGAAPQESAFPETLRVAELAAFVARHFVEPRAPRELLDRFGLAAVAARQVGGLSVGQRRRLAVALAFVGRPELVVLDEPTAGLDRVGRTAVWDAVREVGAAVLVATHHLDEAEAVATQIVAIDRGQIVAEGTVAEIKSRAGVARVRFRSGRLPSVEGARLAHGWVEIDTTDPGAVMHELVRDGERLNDLEVRGLTLEEALGALGAAP